MNPKKLLIVVLAAGVAFGAFQVAHHRAPTRDIESAPLYPMLLEQLNDARRITVSVPGSEQLTIARQGERWGMVERGNFPVDASLVKELLLQVASLRIREAKTAKPELYPSLGVEELSAPKAASRQLVIADGKNQALADLIIGKPRKARGNDSPGLYVRRAGEAGTWLVEGDLALKTKRNDWLETGIANVPVERVRKVTLAQPGQPDVAVAKASRKEQLFTLQEIPTGKEVKSVAQVSNIGGLLLDMRFDDVAAASKVAGLTPVRTATLETFDGLVATLSLYEVEGRRLARFGFEHNPALAEAAPAPTTQAGAENPAGTEAPSAGKPAPSDKPVDVAAEAKMLSEKTRDWAYQLPDYKLRTLDKQLDDLVKPKETRQAPAAAP